MPCSPYNLSRNCAALYYGHAPAFGRTFKTEGTQRPDDMNATRVVGVKLFNIAHINIGCCERRF